MRNEYNRYAVPRINKGLSTKYVMASQFLKGIGISRFEEGEIPQ
jgi:hypothetical protein